MSANSHTAASEKGHQRSASIRHTVSILIGQLWPGIMAASAMSRSSDEDIPLEAVAELRMFLLFWGHL